MRLHREEAANNSIILSFCCWDVLSYGLNTLGPLCLWQCFKHFPSYDVSKVDEERKVAAVSEFYKKAAENPIADVDAGRLLLSGGINHNVAGLNIF